MYSTSVTHSPWFNVSDGVARGNERTRECYDLSPYSAWAFLVSELGRRGP